MIVRGGWIAGIPMLSAVVKLPGSNPSYPQEFLIDTASAFTFLSETEIRNRDDLKTFEVSRVRTIMGPLPTYLVPDCRIVFHDDEGTPHTIRLSLYFLKEPVLNRLQHLVFKTVFGKGFPRRIQAPRYLLGRDVLDRFLLVARPPHLLLLTDEFDSFEGPFAPPGNINWLD